MTALPAPTRIGQGARDDLRRVEIRRDVDIGCADELDQFFQADEADCKKSPGLQRPSLAPAIARTNDRFHRRAACTCGWVAPTMK